MATDLNDPSATLPSDHEVRMERALLSLDGLSVGDGFGECFFTREEVIERRLKSQQPPPAPWPMTDDRGFAEMMK